MKHNKKRNTAFLYECLIRELTKAIVQENKSKQAKVKALLREFFLKGKALKVELDIYKSLMETKDVDEDFSRRLLHESKLDFTKLDRKEVFNEQTSLINKISRAGRPLRLQTLFQIIKIWQHLDCFSKMTTLKPKKE